MTTLAGTNAWVLSNDEATAAEQAEVNKEKEDKILLRNKEFEKNKEEFDRISLPTWKIERRRTATAEKKQESADGHLTHQGQQLFQGQEVREIFGALYGCAKGHPI